MPIDFGPMTQKETYETTKQGFGELTSENQLRFLKVILTENDEHREELLDFLDNDEGEIEDDLDPIEE